MIPDASICGFIFIHPEASYPEIRHLDKTSLDDYARRRGLDEEQCHRFLGYLLDGEFGEGGWQRALLAKFIRIFEAYAKNSKFYS